VADWFKLEMTNLSCYHLKIAIEMILASHVAMHDGDMTAMRTEEKRDAIDCYHVNDDGRLEVYKASIMKQTAQLVHSFLIPIDAELASKFIMKWLHSQYGADYPRPPDTDGSCKRGYTISSDAGYNPHFLFSIQPTWIVFGK
jgi:hypothetical protein